MSGEQTASRGLTVKELLEKQRADEEQRRRDRFAAMVFGDDDLVEAWFEVVGEGEFRPSYVLRYQEVAA